MDKNQIIQLLRDADDAIAMLRTNGNGSLALCMAADGVRKSIITALEKLEKGDASNGFFQGEEKE